MKELYFKCVKNTLNVLYYKPWFKLNFLYVKKFKIVITLPTSLHVEASK